MHYIFMYMHTGMHIDKYEYIHKYNLLIGNFFLLIIVIHSYTHIHIYYIYINIICNTTY